MLFYKIRFLKRNAISFVHTVVPVDHLTIFLQFINHYKIVFQMMCNMKKLKKIIFCLTGSGPFFSFKALRRVKISHSTS